MLRAKGEVFEAVVPDEDERGVRIQLCGLPIVARVVAHKVEPGDACASHWSRPIRTGERWHSSGLLNPLNLLEFQLDRRSAPEDAYRNLYATPIEVEFLDHPLKLAK